MSYSPFKMKRKGFPMRSTSSALKTLKGKHQEHHKTRPTVLDPGPEWMDHNHIKTHHPNEEATK